MSSGIEPYRIDLTVLTGLLGDPDETLVAEAVQRCAQEISVSDGQRHADIAEGLPGLAEGIRQLMAGRREAGLESLYGYALKALCGAYAEMLPNDAFMPGGGIDVLEEFGEDLTRLQFQGPKPLDFLFNGTPPPIELAEAEYPGIGHVEPWLCGPLGAMYDVIAPHLSDPDWTDMATQLSSWMVECGEKGHALVTFYL